MFHLEETGVALWLLLIGSLGVVAMGVDKGMARFNWGNRISERSLWSIALAGGFWGIIVGAFLFHHKTSKGKFWPPVVLASLLWISAAIVLTRFASL